MHFFVETLQEICFHTLGLLNSTVCDKSSASHVFHVWHAQASPIGCFNNFLLLKLMELDLLVCNKIKYTPIQFLNLAKG